MFAIRGSWWRPVASRSSTRGAYFASIMEAAAARNPSSPAPFSTGSPSPTVKRVGTHNGSFHCDEALGCFLIRLTNKFSGADIVRTRDPQLLETLDAVLDVGGMYDPSHDRYDHHQKGFGEIFGYGFSTKLSSAGLVYKLFSTFRKQGHKPFSYGNFPYNCENGPKRTIDIEVSLPEQHYGKEIIAKELQLDMGHENVQRLYVAVYKSFIEAIDAVDNGINEYDIDQPPKYVNNTHLSSRVGRLNLDWMDPDQSSDKENAAFQHAMMLAGGEFLDSLRFHARSWLPARSIVAECIASRGNVDPSGEIMILDRYCPWKHHLFELEEELKIEPHIKYVLYQDERTGSWRVQTVAVSPYKFESRKLLPPAWRGLRDQELSDNSGIPGCVFVHITGFIGGNQTYDGALAMAKTALTT